MERVEPTSKTTEEAEVTTRKAPDPERAIDIMRPVIVWLNRQSRETKLAAQLVQDLLRHEHVFKNDGMYDGNLGQEFDAAWSAEVFAGRSFADLQTEYVRGFAAFLSKMSS